MKCISCHRSLEYWSAYCPSCGTRQPDVPEPDDYRYAAFISYRHLPRDTQVATEVQQAIETFRLPRGVQANTPGEPRDVSAPRYQSPTRTHAPDGHDAPSSPPNPQPSTRASKRSRMLGKCFRDEDELTAAHSLPDRIRAALAQSRTLVVVCSPETPRSTWIDLEIATFAQLHGRERIFTVLADGGSQQSIPEALKTRTVVDIDGEPRIVAAQPLAADFRTQAASHANAETLRIIASVAGCGFDDLRQREQVRKRRRFLKQFAIVGAAVIAIGGFALFGTQANRDAQISESHKLALESQRQLQQGDRYGAIETALEALPSSSTSNDRPFVAEAQTALEEALEIYPDSSSLWRASYTIDPPAGLANLSRSAEGEWTAVLDNDLNLTVNSQFNNRKLATCTLPLGEGSENDKNPQYWSIRAYHPFLLAYNFQQTGIIACFDASTGVELWHEYGVFADGVCCTADNSTTAFCYIQDNGDGTTRINVARVDLLTGEPNGVQILERTDFPYPNTSSMIPTAISGDGSTFFVAANNRIAAIDMDSGAMNQTSVERTAITTMRMFYDMPIVASYDEVNTGSSIQVPYSIESFDHELNRRWSHQGEGKYQMTNAGVDKTDNRFDSVDIGRPQFGNEPPGSPAIIAFASNSAFALNPETGDQLYQEQFDMPVIEACGFAADDEKHLLMAATSNGTVGIRDPMGVFDAPLYHSADLQLQQETSWAAMRFVKEKYFTVLVQGAESARDGKSPVVACYRTNFTSDVPDEGKTDYTLDELIDYAHELLSQAGK